VVVITEEEKMRRDAEGQRNFLMFENMLKDSQPKKSKKEVKKKSA